MTATRRRVVGTSRDASRALASALAMAAPAPASASLVRVDALDRVFDIIDANRDGSLTVQEFILVRPPASPPEAGEERSLGPLFFLPRRLRSARPRRARRSLRLLTPLAPPPPVQALRKNPEVGRLLDVGTVVREEEDSRDLFERVFQRLDRDADRVVTRREFREYFLPEPAAPPANRSAAAAALTTPPRSPAPSAPTSRPSTRGGGGGGGGDHDAARRPPSQTTLPPLDEEWASPPPRAGCCVSMMGGGGGGGGARARRSKYANDGAPSGDKPAPLGVAAQPKATAGALPQMVAGPTGALERTPGSRGERSRARVADEAVSPPVITPGGGGGEKGGENAAAASSAASPMELATLREEIARLKEERDRAMREGETLRSERETLVSDFRRAGEREKALERARERERARLAEMEKENDKLRSEFNLQSLKQDMLVHMWSMHMLDADVEEEM